MYLKQFLFYLLIKHTVYIEKRVTNNNYTLVKNQNMPLKTGCYFKLMFDFPQIIAKL